MTEYCKTCFELNIVSHNGHSGKCAYLENGRIVLDCPELSAIIADIRSNQIEDPYPNLSPEDKKRMADGETLRFLLPDLRGFFGGVEKLENKA